MKVVKSYNLDSKVADNIKRYAFGFEKSESALAEEAFRYFLEHGIPEEIKEEFRRRREILDSIKNSRSIGLKEAHGDGDI